MNKIFYFSIIAIILMLYFLIMLLTMPNLPSSSLIWDDWDKYQRQKAEYCEAEDKWCRFDIIKYFQKEGYCDEPNGYCN